MWGGEMKVHPYDGEAAYWKFYKPTTYYTPHTRTAPFKQGASSDGYRGGGDGAGVTYSVNLEIISKIDASCHSVVHSPCIWSNWTTTGLNGNLVSL